MRFNKSMFVWLGMMLGLAANAYSAGNSTEPAKDSDSEATATPSLVILQYHHISDVTPEDTSISPALFKQHMELVKSLGLPVVSLGDGLQRLRAGKLKGTAVAITFDDAYESIFTDARPVLRELKFPYAVFVATDPVDQKTPGFMTWDNLRQISREGVVIGNHSADHTHYLRRSDEESAAHTGRLKDVTWKSHKRIVDEIGIEPRFFAYPFGEFDNEVREIMKSFKYTVFAQHSGAISVDSDMYALPRFPLNNRFGQVATLKDKLLSLPLTVKPEARIDTRLVENPPTLTLDLNGISNYKQLQCYTSGRGVAKIKWDGTVATIKATKALKNRRERYNCTVKNQEGRYYWYSQPWFDASKPET